MSTLPSRASSSHASRRDGRFGMREWLNDYSSLKRLNKCGFALASLERGVPIVVNEGVAHFQNVQLCASVHSCPVCGPRIRQERAREIDRIITWALEAGHGIYFLTNTVPHDQGDALEPMLEAVADSFSFCHEGRKWAGSERWEHGCGTYEVLDLDGLVRLEHECGRPELDRAGRSTGHRCPARVWKRTEGMRERARVLGSVRSLDITLGINGWHPHLHSLIITETPLEELELEELLAYYRTHWGARVQRHGYRIPSTAHGVTLEAIRSSSDAAAYLTKVNEAGAVVDRKSRVSLELTRHDLKQSRRKGRTPFALLADLVQAHELAIRHHSKLARKWADEDAARWFEYERATFGKQAITFSAGLRAMAGLLEELTDDEIVLEELGGERVCELHAEQWRIVRRIRGARARLLHAAETGGRVQVVRVLGELIGERYDLPPLAA